MGATVARPQPEDSTFNDSNSAATETAAAEACRPGSVDWRSGAFCNIDLRGVKRF
jgi:hypothetical protein